MIDRRPLLRAAVALAVALSFAGVSCSRARDERVLLVFAAASLTDAFAVLETEFEAANPGVDVQLNLAGSSRLREQLLDGAPADVFASADTATMQAVVDAGLTGTAPEPFARNHLAIAVPFGNPAGVTALADFGRADLVLGLCAEEVPCGILARQALQAAGVAYDIDTAEPDVRALLIKIEAGELDAGIVYRSDVSTAGGLVEGIDLDPAVDVQADYPIVTLAASAQPDLAEEFVGLVLSGAGRQALVEAGFDTP